MVKTENEIEIENENHLESDEIPLDEDKTKKVVSKIEVNKSITTIELYYFKMK